MIVTSTRLVDPSRTISLRNAFSKALRSRFNVFTKTLISTIVDDNVFGFTTNAKPGPRAFAYPNTSDKLSAFMAWFRTQVVDDILQVSQVDSVNKSVDGSWLNIYMQDAYKAGIIRSRTQLMQAETRSGLVLNAKPKKKKQRKVQPLSKTGGVSSALNTPSHIERLSMLYSRTFTELKGVTDAMEKQISKILGEGLLRGISPIELASQLNQVITGQGDSLEITDTLGRFIPSKKRAELIARTEVIRAFAEAQLTEFENWGAYGVVAKAELLTTGDERVCPKCSSLEKQIITIEEARGVIPVHPLCRCIWIPFFE